MVYVATEAPLPYWEWGIPSRYIEVSGPHEAGPDLGSVFSKPHVYAVGAAETGDACGFQYDSPVAQLAREELAAFLDHALARVPEVELFAQYCDETIRVARPSSYDRIGPSDIRTWRSWFRPDEFLLVEREV
jgi:hypothetical protein